MNRMVRRAERGEDGAILIIAILVVTAVALVTGAVLTRGDGSLRAAIKLRDVARTSYAADSAAQVATNALRTGYNIGNGEPTDWVFDNTDGTGCFGYDGTDPNKVAKDTLTLDNLIPKVGPETQNSMSAKVKCTPEDATGAQGSAVPINNTNKPGYAIVTLGGPLTTSDTLKVHGGVYSNSTINGPVTLDAGDAKAVGACSQTTVVAPATKQCNTGNPLADPNYGNELGGSVPTLRKPPTSCASGVATFEPGYYDDAAALTTATNLCSTAWFKPGTYYFDFHNDSCANVCPTNVYGSAGNTWTVNGRNLVGGTPINASGATLSAPTSNPTFPGSCRSPITDTSAVGVQFVFGGNSRMYIDQNSQVELCGDYHADRPPIVIYGLKNGDTPAAATANGLDVTSVGGTGNFTGATVPNLKNVDGNQATNANLAVWARDNTGANSAQASSLTVSGFAPGTTLPKGSVVTAATLKVTHRSTGDQNAMTLTPNLGTGPITYTLPTRANLGTETIDLTARTGWSAFQKAVHDEGYSGASFKFDASLARNQTSQLDAVSLDLTYYVPVLRGQSGTCVSSGTSCPLMSMKNGNNKILLYMQGTTYAPLSYFDILLGNFSAEVAKFGIVARQLDFAITNGNPSWTGPIFEIPDNSPGFGFSTTFVRLEVYLCPGTTFTCATNDSTLALKARVLVADPTGAPIKDKREITILNWNHPR